MMYVYRTGCLYFISYVWYNFVNSLRVDILCVYDIGYFISYV
jgi:hypothetical protein